MNHDDDDGEFDVLYGGDDGTNHPIPPAIAELLRSLPPASMYDGPIPDPNMVIHALLVAEDPLTTASRKRGRWNE